VLAEVRNPVGIITKNHLVTRDVDLLRELAACGAVCVNISLTTLRNELQRVMEPQTSVPARRLAAVETLARAGVPVGIMIAPLIPGLTDEEMPTILQAARAAGAGWAGYVAPACRTP
jgi:DNA repair photolyase